MSPMTPAPTANPGDAPNACTKRHAISWFMFTDDATPTEPMERRGRPHKYIGLRPSEGGKL